jgi:FMN reductase
MAGQQEIIVTAPFIVGIGGTTRAQSSTNLALNFAMAAVEKAGAKIAVFDGPFLLRLPVYDPEVIERSPAQLHLLEVVRRAQGVIIASPGYHGGVSALVKNALDLLEDLRDDDRPYLTGRPIGCIVTAYGWQACGTTLTALRAIAHALRGWPTPLGATLNSAQGLVGENGGLRDEKDAFQLSVVAQQVMEFHGHAPR